MITKSEKEKLANNIEQLLRKSFYEGSNDDDVKSDAVLDEDGNVDIWRNGNNPRYKFALEYLLRSKCYFSIDHLMDYIKREINKV